MEALHARRAHVKFPSRSAQATVTGCVCAASRVDVTVTVPPDSSVTRCGSESVMVCECADVPVMS